MPSYREIPSVGELVEQLRRCEIKEVVFRKKTNAQIRVLKPIHFNGVRSLNKDFLFEVHEKCPKEGFEEELFTRSFYYNTVVDVVRIADADANNANADADANNANADADANNADADANNANADADDNDANADSDNNANADADSDNDANADADSDNDANADADSTLFCDANADADSDNDANADSDADEPYTLYFVSPTAKKHIFRNCSYIAKSPDTKIKTKQTTQTKNSLPHKCSRCFKEM